MKKIVSLGLAMLIGCSTCITAFAANDNVVTYKTENGGGGYVIVTEDDIIPPEGVALRAPSSEYVYDGNTKAGYWVHGNRSGTLVSEMKSYDPYEGRASVTNGAGDYEDGGWQPADTWSKASLTWSFWGTNKANYDYR